MTHSRAVAEPVAGWLQAITDHQRVSEMRTAVGWFSRRAFSAATAARAAAAASSSASASGAAAGEEQQQQPQQSKAQRFVLDAASHTFPRGFLATGVHCGVKKKEALLDLALIVSDRADTSAAACFTRNAFVAAPVHVSKDVLRQSSGHARAIVVNSGCANAVTGEQGLKDAWAMSKAVDDFLYQSSSADNSVEASEGGDKPATTLVMSTGVIGQLLPIKRITSGITSAVSTLGGSHDAWLDCARAFMTTDTFPKLRTRKHTLPDGTAIRFVGIDKGAGMIHPNMGPPAAPHATLLGMLATDARVPPAILQAALTHAVDRSFNSISVDGDMSTNDTIVALANGAAAPPSGKESLTEITQEGTPELFESFTEALTGFCADLAQLVVRDGEGATKLVKVSVNGAPSYEGAHKVAASVAKSALVKCAVHGQDANWGRILCAVGYSNPGFEIVPQKTSVSFVPTDGSAELKLLVNGEPEQVDEARALEILKMEDLEIAIELGVGSESAAYWTCDFSKEYIAINAGKLCAISSSLQR